uniref:Solute carrier family 35 member C2 n=1 Tax=Echinococcus granulosus TaxID=6210 RepID=A0A068WP88_ECHGR|nr:solute carrier family 35 member C2 [Echinococcus granulosus]
MFFTFSIWLTFLNNSVIKAYPFAWFLRGILWNTQNKKCVELPWRDYVLEVSPTGLFMFTYESTQFDLKGFTLVLIASALSGIRWTTAQKVTQQSVYGLSNPIDVIYHTQPWMALVLLPLAFSLEGDEFLTSPFLFRSHDYLGTCRTLGYFVFGACLAFGLEVAEFLVVCNSSSLTLSIAGIFKEVVTLYLAAAVNGDQYSPTNIAGLVICLAGICLHVAIRFFKHTAILRLLLCQNRQMTHLPKKLRPGRLTSLPSVPIRD